MLILPGTRALADPPAESFTVAELPKSPSDLERLFVRVAVGLGAEESAEGALIEIDLNAWRSASPDDFVPGPLNDILGALGLADARTLVVFFQNDELMIRWNRRMRDEGEQSLGIASRDAETDTRYEEWDLAGVKPGRIVRAIARIWFAINQSELDESSWVRIDQYARSRSSLLASVDRACEAESFVVTTEGAVGLVFEFERGVKLASLMRAIDRVAPREPVWTETATRNHRVLGAISIRGNEFEPAVVVGRVSEKSVVVIGLGADDAMGVYRVLAKPDTE